MVDYSLQKNKVVEGSHAESINLGKFKKFLKKVKDHDFDLMLEIKGKEKSALKAIYLVNQVAVFKKSNF